MLCIVFSFSGESIGALVAEKSPRCLLYTSIGNFTALH